jgi:son of sevenless-like protein
LTDLTFIELGNPDYLPETHFINIEKRRKVHGVIRDIQDYQLQKYDFTLPPLDVPTDAEWKILTEDQLYERSLLVEPPTEEDE